jgi:hypothetical protein
MDLHTVIAASGNGSANFIVGILLGSCLGYLTGPAIRSWQSYKEWAEASREARLADRFLTGLETADADLPVIEDRVVEADRATEIKGHIGRRVWRTSH